MPVLRKDLEEFIEDLEYWHPNIKFDFSYLEYFERKNLWFLDIFQNQKLKNALLSKILEDGQNDSDDMEKIFSVLKQTCKEERGIEGINGLFDRAQKLKMGLL